MNTIRPPTPAPQIELGRNARLRGDELVVDNDRDNRDGPGRQIRNQLFHVRLALPCFLRPRLIGRRLRIPRLRADRVLP